jgi:hypothetical protein
MRYMFLLLLLFSASAFAGSIHKWVDENGNTHYGDSPPVQAATQSVKVTGTPSDTGKALPRLAKPDGESSSSADVSADQAKILCEQSKADLHIIKNSSRIKITQADGIDRFLTTEEVKQRSDKASNDVEKYCP